MPGPARLVRAAVGLPLNVARHAAGFAVRLLPGVGGDDGARDEPRRTASPVARAEQPPGPEARAEAAAAAEGALRRERDIVEEPPAAFDDPATGHVEAEEEIVRESADVEATEPPGPEFHVEEPWEGYRRMRASEIAARLEGQPAEVLAAVELYETTHRKRPAVLNAVRSIRA